MNRRKSGIIEAFLIYWEKRGMERGSVISLDGSGCSGNLELVREDLHDTEMDMGIDNRNEVPEEPSNGGMSATSMDSEIQDLAENREVRNLDNDNEMGDPQDLSLLEMVGYG